MRSPSIYLLMLLQTLHFRSALALRMPLTRAFHHASTQSSPGFAPALKLHRVRDFQLRLSAVPPPEAEWSSCRVVRNVNDAKGLRAVDIEVSREIADQYLHPGQYVKVKAGEMKPSFFAIASPPDSRGVFSFLVKEVEANDFILKAGEGDSVQLSAPMGKGFQINEYVNNYKKDFPVNAVVLLACGSGLAPIAAAIESQRLGLGGTVYESLFSRKATLYVGAKTPEHLPFRGKYAEWEKMGVKVVPVLSQPSDPLSAAWTGRTGYVQQALRDDGVPVPKNCVALLCGVRDMTDNVKDLLLEAGVFEGRILLNF